MGCFVSGDPAGMVPRLSVDFTAFDRYTICQLTHVTDVIIFKCIYVYIFSLV